MSSLSISEEATRRKCEKQYRDQIEALKKQLETSENRLREALLLKKTLYHDFEKQGKDLKLCDRRNTDLVKENTKLQQQVEALLKLNGGAKSGGVPIQHPASVHSAGVQLRKAKDTILKYEQEIDIYKEREASFQERIISLEEGLLKQQNYQDMQYSSNNAALAEEHADLLAKMALLRGDVGAIRVELERKNRQINEFEMKNHTIRNNHHELQYHIQTLESKLNKSDKENGHENRSVAYGGNERDIDMSEEILRLQREKDALLSHVQCTEHDKSLNVNKEREYEAIINELRVSEALAKQQLAYMQDVQSNDWKLKYTEMEIENKNLAEQIEKYQKSHSKKETEIEELSKMQVSLLKKIKHLENDVEETQETLQALKSRNKELELDNEVVIDDNEKLRKKLICKDKEIVNLQESSSAGSLSSSKLYSMEPELLQLRREKTNWLEFQTQAQCDSEALRYLDDLLLDIKAELEISNHALVSEAQAHDKNTENDDKLPISHKHSIWTSIPKINALLPDLYKHIRTMYQDLLSLENKNNNMEMKINTAKVQYEELLNRYYTEVGRLLPKEAEMTSMIDEYKSRKEESTEEQMKNMSARTTLEQIRIILNSTPGGITSNLMQQFEINAESIMDNPPQSPVKSGGNDPMVASELSNTATPYDRHLSSPVSHMTHSLITSLKGLVDSTGLTRSSDAAENSKRDISVINIDKISDQQLPELIGKIITRNANCVTGLRDSLLLYEQLMEEYKSLQQELHTSQAENKNLQKLLSDLKEQHDTQNLYINSRDETISEELNSAAELAEKQNALIVTLEAKIAGQKRDKQLRHAQISTFVQREEHVRILLWNLLEQYMIKTQLLSTMGIPPKGAKLTEMMSFVHHLLSAVQNYEHAVLNRPISTIPPPVATPMAMHNTGMYSNEAVSSVPPVQSKTPISSIKPFDSQANTQNNSMRFGGIGQSAVSYKDNKKVATHEEIVVPPPITTANTSSPLTRSVSSMYADVDIITAPDVQPRYSKTLPIRAYSTSFSSQMGDADENASSGDDPDDIEKIKNNSIRRTASTISSTAETTSFSDFDRTIIQRKKNANALEPEKQLNADGDILHERLVRAQNAFASMREPKTKK